MPLSASERARIQRHLKNPGTRAKLDAKYLSPAQRAERQRLQTARAPVVPGSSLTNQDAAREREATVGLRFGDADRQVQNERGISDQQQRNIGGWYDQYKVDLQALAQRQAVTNAAGAAQAQALVQGVGAQGAGAQQSAAVNGQMQADAQLRGAQTDPNASAVEGNAALIRQAMQAAQGGAQAAQGASRIAALLDKERIAGGDRIQQGLNESRRRGQIETSARDITKQKGEFRVKTTADIREREAKSALERAVFGAETQQAGAKLALDAAGQAGTTADRNADNAREDAQARRDAERDKYQREHGLGPYRPPAPRRGSGDGNGFNADPTYQRKVRSQLSPAQAVARELKRTGRYDRHQAGRALTNGQEGRPVFETVRVPNANGRGHRTVQRRVLNPDGSQQTTRNLEPVDPLVARAAVDIAYDGHVSRKTAELLTAAGIRVSALGVPTYGSTRRSRRRRPPASQPGNAPGPGNSGDRRT